MRKVNLNDIADDERKSPKGKFHKFVKDISSRSGAKRNRSISPNGIRLISHWSAFPKAKATVRIMAMAPRRSSTSLSQGKEKSGTTAGSPR